MKTINLRSEYPELYHRDMFVEVADEVADLLDRLHRESESQARKDRRYGVDVICIEDDDEINISTYPSPYQECVLQEQLKVLYQAIFSLPLEQRRRVYLHYIAGVSQTDIAIAEGVSQPCIYKSISRSLFQLRKILKNFSCPPV